MLPNGHKKRHFLKKLGDRIVYILTGKNPSRRRHSRPKIRPEEIAKKEQEPIIRKPVTSQRRRKPGIAGFFNNIINPAKSKKKKKRPHTKRIIIRSQTDEFEQKLDRLSDSIDDSTNVQSIERKPETHIIRRRRSRRNQSFFEKFFGTPRTKEKKRKDPEQNFSEDFRKALPAESYALFNSMGFYMLAYLVVYFIYQFTEALVAATFGIDSVLFYYEIYFPIGNASPLWDRFNIIAITLASPFVSLIIALILLRVVLMREKLNPQLRLFFLWVAFHSATHFLGAFVAGIVTSQGFGYVANWLFMNVFFRILVSLIFLFLLTITGYYSAVFVLETIPAGIRQHRWRLSMALGARIILPWIIGGLLIIVAKYPDAIPQHPNIMIYDAVIIATMGFMVIPAFFNYKAKPRSLVERPRRNSRPPGIMVFAVAFLTLILFRMAFDRGIHLIMNFSFDVGFYR